MNTFLFSLPSMEQNGTIGDLTWGISFGTLVINGVGAMPDYVEYTSAIPWYNFKTTITQIIIKSGVTAIGNSVFQGCKNLTTVKIPDTVTSIGRYAFNGCQNLTSISIPESVTSIGDYAFSDCTGLDTITIQDSITSIGGTAFDETAWYNNQPDGMVYLERILYKYKGNMKEYTSVNIKEGTSVIASSAFSNCNGLISVIIPESVTNIGSSAFYGCNNLEWVTIPRNITTIERATFYDCTSLTSVIIPESVTSIESSAFYGCTAFAHIYVQSISPSTIGRGSFEGIDFTSCILHVPMEGKGNYEMADGWKNFCNIEGSDFSKIERETILDKINVWYNTTTHSIDFKNFEGILFMAVFDMNDKMVLSGSVSEGESVSVSNFPCGAYSVRIQSYTFEFQKE
ncbi:leucine-rich repeat domain-containing protein [Dysgonomonas sp. 520]|uniref:leucine-rich repeat domain-containing protein n=1 Tax=Dysgonomonas sp. 520 TaxID=2302931 RepID=UPI0013D2158E|nr:leucine-rich repeat domain-containing protein [Dysgonomonas sp. 520]NDW11026.1 leucine-rich repeat domain-containing protein [Dysgonomonas sp. 520]